MEQITNFLKSDLGSKLIIILFVILSIWTILAIIKKVVPKYVATTNSRYRVRKIINTIGYALIVVSILIVFSNQLTGFTVFLGVAGAGIAFALQEVIASVAGYIAIYTSNFYSIGDRVSVGGIKGDVIDIGLLRTTLMEIGDWVDGDLYNGKITRVANSFIFKEPVFNYSGDFPFLWDEAKIPIKTNSDFEYAREKFLEIVNEIQGDYAINAKVKWDKLTDKLMVEKANVAPMISMVFDENWITFTLRYVVDFKARRFTKDRIMTEVLKAINNSNGKIEVASAAFEITAFPNVTTQRNPSV